MILSEVNLRFINHFPPYVITPKEYFMKDLIDLHVHSHCSDGSFSPTELVALAAQKGLKAFALTDHDTTDGIDEAIHASAQLTSPIEIIPGIELSTYYNKKDIHIIGLGIQKDNIYFKEKLLVFQNSRDARNVKIMANLRDSGIDITHEKMHAAFGDTIWTRAHIAKFLFNHGYVKNQADAFARYIGDDAPCFVPRVEVTPYQGIDLIHEGGGVAILAHPLLYSLSTTELDTLVSKLVHAGLDGIEAMYSMNRYGDEQRMKTLAKKYSLKLSGGSDFHGSNRPNVQLGTGKGNINITYDTWKNLSTSN